MENKHMRTMRMSPGMNTLPFHGALFGLGLLVAVTTPSRVVYGQQPIIIADSVTIAKAPESRKEKGGHILHRAENGRPLVILGSADTTPARLAAALAGLRGSQFAAKGNGSPNAIYRVKESDPRPLTTAQTNHYRKMLARLDAAPTRAIPGLGQVQAIDVLVYGVTARPGGR
jgi:hypothetical protein